MRMKGLEPPRPESLDPKSNAATNYATCALGAAKVMYFFRYAAIFDAFFVGRSKKICFGGVTIVRRARLIEKKGIL